MGETWRIDKRVCDHRRLQVGKVVLVVDTRGIDRPVEGDDVLEEGVFDGIFNRRSTNSRVGGVIDRNEEIGEVLPQRPLTRFAQL